jgi:hypothetical protein
MREKLGRDMFGRLRGIRRSESLQTRRAFTWGNLPERKALYCLIHGLSLFVSGRTNTVEAGDAFE